MTSARHQELFLSPLNRICCLAESISCYQCNSTDIYDQFRCTEFMDTYDLTPQPCTDVYKASYCIKLIGRYERKCVHPRFVHNRTGMIRVFIFSGGLGVKRYCSSHDLGNYCNYVKQPGDVLEYRTCVYTCNSDGCNGSSRTMVFGYLMGISFLPLLRWLLF